MVDAELAGQQEIIVPRMLPIHHSQPLRLLPAAGGAYWLNVVFEIGLVVLDGAIADEDFANRARKVNGHWLILAELAAIVVQLGQSKNVLSACAEINSGLISGTECNSIRAKRCA